MNARWQRWRRPVGVVLIVILVPVLGIAWIIKQIETPYQSPGWVSPHGQWRVWLERPDGSMEPMYYTLKARRESIFATPVCEIGSLKNWFAERYTRAVWSAHNRMILEYGLSDRDTGGVGVPGIGPVPKECAGLVVEARRNRALDAQATRTNENNQNYAIPVPDQFPMTPSDTSSPSPLS